MKATRLISTTWDSFWFPRSTAVRLGFCRVLTVGLQLFVFFPRWQEQVAALRYPHLVWAQWLIRVPVKLMGEQTFRSVGFLHSVWWITLVSGVFALVGLATRPATFLFAIGNGLLIAHVYSYGAYHHPEALFCIFLFLLALSPSGRCFSVDAWIGKRWGRADRWGTEAVVSTGIWPLRLTQCLLGMAYLNAAFYKLTVGGLAWVNGYTLQTVLLQDYMRWDQRFPSAHLGHGLGLWVAEHHWLCLALSVATVLFEGTFFVTVFIRRVRPLYLAAGVAMHMLIFLMQRADFWQFLVLYVVFLPVDEWWRWLVGRRHAPETASVEAAATAR